MLQWPFYIVTFFGLSVTTITGLKQLTNNRPIIGILTQENILEATSQLYPRSKYNSYIAASYVKFVEGAGGRVVPIWINQDLSYYKNIVRSINGILFPGGGADFNEPGGYAAAGKTLYNLALQMNLQGDYFPLWGTCLGFELLTFLAANEIEHRAVCSDFNHPRFLELIPGYLGSKLFRYAPEDVISSLKEKPVAVFYHTFCVTRKNFTALQLDETWTVLSVNSDVHGIQFISSIESRSLPFYGIMYHVEKNLYEWNSTKNIPHFAEAVEVSQYFANFFVSEARKNGHSFATAAEERHELIYNYLPTYTGNVLFYEQCYFFEK